MLAIAERVDVEQLESLVDHAALEQLETGRSRRHRAGRNEDWSPFSLHPLHGEAARSSMPALRRGRVVLPRSPKALERAGMPEPGDGAGRPLAAGGRRRPGPRAADPGGAPGVDGERFRARRAARARRPGRRGRIRAAFVVAECMMATGRHDEAETAMADLQSEAAELTPTT